jgi:ubiquinone/menaquinone biosynthesis C-methylase UbiE
MSDAYKKYWDIVYETKNPEQVSWTQEVPKTSLDFIDSFNISKSSKIIDIGGGDSKLVDYLLGFGFEDITVLDISAVAIEKAKHRLGKEANKVKWIVSDIVDFEPTTIYDVWHDRATFHFLTTNDQINRYLTTAIRNVNGFMTIGTFSNNGPTKCSGLDVKQYTENTLTSLVGAGFEKLKCINEDHTTPFNTKQNFLFCSFKRRTNISAN